MHKLIKMNKNHHSNNILLNLGIENLNEMQIAAQETILSDNNILLLSPTGSGKTLAFLLPIMISSKIWYATIRITQITRSTVLAP